MKRSSIVLVVGFLASIAIAVFVSAPGQAQRNPGGAHPGNVNATCTGTAAIIQVNPGQIAIDCTCDSAVSFGDSAVLATDKSQETYTGNANYIYCISGGSVACACNTLSRIPGSP